MGGNVTLGETVTERDVQGLRRRYREALKACEVLVVKPADQLTNHERRVLEPLDEGHDALCTPHFEARRNLIARSFCRKSLLQTLVGREGESMLNYRFRLYTVCTYILSRSKMQP